MQQIGLQATEQPGCQQHSAEKEFMACVGWAPLNLLSNQPHNWPLSPACGRKATSLFPAVSCWKGLPCHQGVTGHTGYAGSVMCSGH